MQSLVVFIALAVAAHGSYLHPHAYVSQTVVPAVVAAPAVVALPSAVSHQSRVDYRSNPTIVSTHTSPVLTAAPLWGHSLASPLLAYSGLHGHYLKKRSLGHWGAVAYTTPYIPASAVSHQSRVDVVSSPTIVSESVATPLISHAVAAPVLAHSAPVLAHSAPVLAHSAPVLAHSAPLFAHSSPVWGASPLLAYSGLHGHYIKKRSLGHWGAVAYSTPYVPASAVTHESRVDVSGGPTIVSQAVATPLVAHTVAAPVVTHAVATPVIAHAIAPSAVSHQSRVDVRTSPAVVSESVVTAPLLHSTPYYGHGLFGW